MEDEDQESPIATTEALRERLLERFASWLDEALARREPPAGIAAEILAELEAAAGDDESPSSGVRKFSDARFGIPARRATWDSLG